MAKKQDTGGLQEQLNAQRRPFLVPIISVLSGFFTPCFVVSPPSSPDVRNVSGKPFLCKTTNRETAENPLVSLKWELSASVSLWCFFSHSRSAACETTLRSIALVLRCKACCIFPFKNHFSLSVADPRAHRQSDQSLWGWRFASVGWRAVLDV